MLTTDRLECILARIPGLSVGVFGDLFLDRYLDIDAALTEPSLETGLDAYQVVRVRPLPGAAGTIINNLVALGARRICPVTVIGDDGEGFELARALGSLAGVDDRWVLRDRYRHTPTYTKPVLWQAGGPGRELNRLDIRTRAPMPEGIQCALERALTEMWPQVDALVVLDQVSEADCGVVTARLRECLADMGRDRPDKLILADSRRHIGLFQSVWLKPNRQESLAAAGEQEVEPAVRRLAERTGRPVLCTLGEQGVLVVDGRSPGETVRVPAYPVAGPIDVVGAGDSASAALACAVAAGAALVEAAAFSNLVASITIQQLGTTGTATAAQVRERWRQVQSNCG